MKAELVESDGRIVAYMDITDCLSYSVSGYLYNVLSWNDDGTPYDALFFAYVMVKWDGCSHFKFRGEDWDTEHVGSADGYYHICGLASYIHFMRMMLFAYEVMAHHVEHVDEMSELREVRKMGLLDVYEIRYVEG